MNSTRENPAEYAGDPATRRDAPELSVVIPVLNEAENIGALLTSALPILESLHLDFEVIPVNDGSRDATPQRLSEWARRCPAVRPLHLSRNFGHQAALVAGLEAARGQAVIMMDGDLQHPPELIPELVRLWRGGAEIVQTIRNQPADDSVVKRAASGAFYRLLSAVSKIRVTPGAADFRLMSRDALNAFLACRERCRFNRGLVQWIGFDYVELPYDAAPRHAGRSKYSWRSQLRLAGDAIFSFSSLPLRLAGMCGALVSLAAGAYLLFVIWARLFTSLTVGGWSSTLATVLALGGMQLVVLWIIGEYLGRLYEEVKQRPIYIIRRTPAQSAAPREIAANPPQRELIEHAHEP